MFKTTRMTKKFQEMKNGGYTLFSDKTKKILLAMGLSLLSVVLFSQEAHAVMSYKITHMKDVYYNKELDQYGRKVEVQKEDAYENDVLKDTVENTYTRYQIEIKESDKNRKLEGIYLPDANKALKEYVGAVKGQQSALVVIEVPKDTEYVILKNNNSNDDGIEISFNEIDAEVDNDGPTCEKESLIQYRSTNNQGWYLQAKFTDKTKVYRIEDACGLNRVVLREKERDKEVELKYMLEPEDEYFMIYDILGNATKLEVPAEEEIPFKIVYNTRNIDGSQIALDIETEYKLTGIKTAAGEDVDLAINGGHVYTNVPSGTTKLVLEYEMGTEDNPKPGELVIPLVLDKDIPVIISYSADGSDETGYTIEKSNEESARARVYFSREQKKGIVEATDLKSGIYKIVTLKGPKEAYEEEVIRDSRGNRVYPFLDDKIKESVLCLFSITDDTTAVRVCDGVGNALDIELTEDIEDKEITVAEFVKDEEGHYKLVTQDIEAGLGSIERDGDATINQNFGAEQDNKRPIKENGETAVYYDQYTLEKYEVAIDIMGQPIIKITDALGNVREVSIDDAVYQSVYATYSEHNAYTNSGSLSVDIRDERGIDKIEITMVLATAEDDPEPEEVEMPDVDEETEMPAEDDPDYDAKFAAYRAWDEYRKAESARSAWADQYRRTYVLEKFRGDLPTKVTKTYLIPEGKVEEVHVYGAAYELGEGENKTSHQNCNTIDELVNVNEVGSDERITVKNSDRDIDRDNSGNITGAKVTAKYGIKEVAYDDVTDKNLKDTVVRFYDELPTELHVNCMVTREDGNIGFAKVVVTDALGDTLTIESDKITLFNGTVLH
ncbi:MAG: hypothetical protein J6Y29_06895 [Clostridiales bacterium]|nr:hypothetical protein [Clostridiales bacterium]